MSLQSLYETYGGGNFCHSENIKTSLFNIKLNIKLEITLFALYRGNERTETETFDRMPR